METTCNSEEKGFTYGDGQVVTASQLGNLAGIAERGTHDDGLVTELLVVVKDALDASNTRVLLLGIFLLGRRLEPVKDAADEGGNQKRTSLGGGNSLDEREHEREVAVDAVVALENLGSLDTFPCGCDLDQNTVLGNALGLVKLCKSKC